MKNSARTFLAMGLACALAACSAEVKTPQAQQDAQNSTPKPKPSSAPEPRFHAEMKDRIAAYLDGIDTLIARYDDWAKTERLQGEVRELRDVTRDILLSTQSVENDKFTEAVSLQAGFSSSYWSVPFTAEDPDAESSPVRVLDRVDFWIIERPLNPYSRLRFRAVLPGDLPQVRDVPASTVTFYPSNLNLEIEPPSYSLTIDRRVNGDATPSFQVIDLGALDSYAHGLLDESSVPRVIARVRALDGDKPIKRFLSTLARMRRFLAEFPGGGGLGGLTALRYMRAEVGRTFDETASSQ